MYPHGLELCVSAAEGGPERATGDLPVWFLGEAGRAYRRK